MKAEVLRRAMMLVKDLVCLVALVAFAVFCFAYVSSHPFVPDFLAWFVLLIAVITVSATIRNLVIEFRYPCTVG